MLGSAEKPLPFLQSSLELREAVAETNPREIRAKRDLARTCNNIGSAYFMLGSAERGLPFLRKSIDLWETVAQGDVHDVESKRDLAMSYSNLAQLYMKMLSPAKAIPLFEREVELREMFASADARNLQAQRELSQAYSKIARANESTAAPAQARLWYVKSLAIDEKWSELKPDTSRARRRIAATCEQIGCCAAQTEDWRAAVTYTRRAIEHARAASAIVRPDEPFQWDFSTTLSNLGRYQAAAGLLKEAISSFEEAITANPASARAYNDLAWVLATAWDDSLRDGKRALALATVSCDLAGSLGANQLDTLAAAYAATGNFADAVARQKEAVAAAGSSPASNLEQLRHRLKLYEFEVPYRLPKPDNSPKP